MINNQPTLIGHYCFYPVIGYMFTEPCMFTYNLNEKCYYTCICLHMHCGTVHICLSCRYGEYSYGSESLNLKE